MIWINEAIHTNIRRKSCSSVNLHLLTGVGHVHSRPIRVHHLPLGWTKLSFLRVLNFLKTQEILLCHCKKLPGAEEAGCRITQCKVREHIPAHPSCLRNIGSEHSEWTWPSHRYTFARPKGIAVGLVRGLLGFTLSKGHHPQRNCSSQSSRSMTTEVYLLSLPLVLRIPANLLGPVSVFASNHQFYSVCLFLNLIVCITIFYTVSVHVNR